MFKTLEGERSHKNSCNGMSTCSLALAGELICLKSVTTMSCIKLDPHGLIGFIFGFNAV